MSQARKLTNLNPSLSSALPFNEGGLRGISPDVPSATPAKSPLTPLCQRGGHHQREGHHQSGECRGEGAPWGRVVLGAAALALIAGCAETPRVDEHFGEAVRAATAQQVVNPDASLNRDPVAGIDGQAANSTIDRYHRSYQVPPPPVNVFTIGVGTGGGGSMSGGGGGTSSQ
jgi:hypothetical protein